MPKVYTPKHGRTGKAKDSFPKLPHCIGRAGAEFAPLVGGAPYRGTSPATVIEKDNLPKGKKGY